MLGVLLFSAFFSVVCCHKFPKAADNVPLLLPVIPPYPPSCPQDPPPPDFSKCHVVIFFTNPDLDMSNNIDGSGISLLQFPVQGNLEAIDKIPAPYRSLFSIDSKEANCERIFQKCLNNLISWATNVKKMVTATVATSKPDYVSAALASSYNSPDKRIGMQMYRFSSFIGPNQMMYKHLPKMSHKRKTFKNKEIILGESTRIARSLKGLPVLRYEVNDGDYPIIDALNPESDEDDLRVIYDIDEPVVLNIDSKIERPQIKILQKPKKIKLIPTFGNIKSTEKNLVSLPTVCLKQQETQTMTIDPFNQDNLLQDNNSQLQILSIFDIISKIRDMFLGGLFSPSVQKAVNTREEDCVDPTVLGKVENKPMFELVRMTLNDIKEQEQTMHSTGYLMVVIGGNISEVKNPFSDLVQSVRYVLEHTNKENTLVLVSCHCPSKEPCMKKRIPYFAKGANSELLKNSANIVDMFGNIRDSLAPYKWTKHRKGVNKFPQETKNRTDILDDFLNDLEMSDVIVGGGRMVRSVSGVAPNIFNTVYSIVIIIVSIICIFALL